jgi:ribosomal protein S18 acetylase RimI-like enzyme
MTISIALAPGTPGRLRPLNVLRDLSPVADLIELCFHNTMDAEGRQYVQEMRRSANDGSFLSWASRAADSVSLPLSGYVWDDGGKIVGNVSLIPFNKQGRRIYLIANVATHPNYRRRGIARLLTETAMQHAREKKAFSIWLHVRDDNPGAIKLYGILGFVERARRTSWHVPPETSISKLIPGFAILPRRNGDWQEQNAWLQQLYPAELSWYQTMDWGVFAPGFARSVYRFVTDTIIEQWSAYHDDRLFGVLAVHYGRGRSDYLWPAVPQVDGDEALGALLIHARRRLSQYRTLILDYPAYQAVGVIRTAGFTAQRTLVWMQAPGKE